MNPLYISIISAVSISPFPPYLLAQSFLLLETPEPRRKVSCRYPPSPSVSPTRGKRDPEGVPITDPLVSLRSFDEQDALSPRMETGLRGMTLHPPYTIFSTRSPGPNFDSFMPLR